MMKKSVLVTHTDLDGVATSVIFLKRCIDYGISNKVYYCDIDEVDDTLNHLIKNDLENEEIENLYIVDVTPKNIDIINALSRYQKNVNIVLFDHHETARERFVNCDWATFDTSKCGVKAFYHYFSKPSFIPYNYRYSSCLDYVNKVDVSDRWIKEDIKLFNSGRKHALLLRALGREKYIENRLKATSASSFLDSEILVLDILESEQALYVEDKIKSIVRFDYDFNNGIESIAIVFCDRCISEIADEMRKRGINEYSAVAGINLSNRTVRIRSIHDDFDCGKFSKKMSVRGGGHKESGGFHIDDDNVISCFLLNVFGKM